MNRKAKNNLNGGYMMLLLLMIGLVLIITLIVRTDLFTNDGKGILEKGAEAIQDAKDTKKNLEDKYKFDPEAQEQSIDDTN
ncbi:MAG TPA: hypothetical protein VJC14_00910 [Candidatus Paceibacterota bacterium]